MLSDVLIPVMACPEALPNLDKHLEKSSLSMSRARDFSQSGE